MSWAAAIQAGGAILGGVLGRNKSVAPGDVIRQTMAGIEGQARGARAAGEAYGFNPMALLGVSQPLVPQAVDNSGFGQSIANAALAVADGINHKSAQAVYTQKLEEQNADLRKALDAQTLRPKVPGIYGRATPTIASAGPVKAPVLSPAPAGALTYGGVYGDVEPTSIYTPYLTRSGVTLPTIEGTDAEDMVSGVVLNAVGNLVQDKTLDEGFVDRLFVNAESLLTTMARPPLQGAKAIALGMADVYKNGPGRRLDSYSTRRYGPGEWSVDENGVALQK